MNLTNQALNHLSTTRPERRTQQHCTGPGRRADPVAGAEIHAACECRHAPRRVVGGAGHSGGDAVYTACRGRRTIPCPQAPRNSGFPPWMAAQPRRPLPGHCRLRLRQKSPRAGLRLLIPLRPRSHCMGDLRRRFTRSSCARAAGQDGSSPSGWRRVSVFSGVSSSVICICAGCV